MYSLKLVQPLASADTMRKLATQRRVRGPTSRRAPAGFEFGPGLPREVSLVPTCMATSPGPLLSAHALGALSLRRLNRKIDARSGRKYRRRDSFGGKDAWEDSHPLAGK